MNEKRVASKYLEYRENVLKYTNIDMNLKLETKKKLQGNQERLHDLQENSLTKTLSKDAIHYINDEITKAKKNIEYYSEILKKLEDKD